MTSFPSSEKVGRRPRRSGRRRKRFPAVSGVHFLILATGVLAFIANLALLRGGEAPRSLIAVSQVDLAPGHRLQPEELRFTAVDAEEKVVSGLVAESELSQYQGWIVAGAAPAGTLISKANLRAPLAESDFRAMSFPIPREHAVGGDLISGDVVDVIRVDEDEARFVATSLTVLNVARPSEGGLGLSGGFHLVLEVDDRTALSLALALANGQVEVVRATGSSPVTVRSLKELRSDPQDPGRSWGQEHDHLGFGSPDSGRYPPQGSGAAP